MPSATSAKPIRLFKESDRREALKNGLSSRKNNIAWVDVSDDENRKRKRPYQPNGVNGHASSSTSHTTNGHPRKKQRNSMNGSSNGKPQANGYKPAFNGSHNAYENGTKPPRTKPPSDKFAMLQEQRMNLPIAQGVSR